MKTIFPVRAFQDNYIWLLVDAHAKAAWAVDPGDAAPVIAWLQEHALTLAGILLTHHHADHSGGILALTQQYPAIPVVGSAKSRIPEVTRHVHEGDTVTCFSRVFTVLEIPGHTLDHIAFYDDEVLFCGDTLFSAGCGRVFEGTYPQMYDSLCKLSQLDDHLEVYCAHEYTQANLRFANCVEPENSDICLRIERVEQLIAKGLPSIPSLMQDEKKTNPFLRCDTFAVAQSAEHYAQQKLSSATEIFQSLREWKNSFRG